MKVADKFFVEITSEETQDKPRRQDDMTAEEAWEIARKLFGGFSDSEMDEIFGKNWSYPTIMELSSPQQAKAKIEAWEAQKEIKVGDVVFHPGANKNCVVTSTNNKGYMHMLDKDGVYHICSDKTCLKRIGRHIDIQSVLKQIGAAEQED